MGVTFIRDMVKSGDLRSCKGLETGRNMNQFIGAIAPIFIIILCGHLIRRTGFLKEGFLTEANRFVFYVSLPFLILTGIVKSGMKGFDGTLALSVVLPSLAVAVVTLSLGYLLGLRNGRLGTFAQTSFHGNVSYIGLAVLVYLMGEKGMEQGSLLVGVLILVNNVLAITVLSWTSKNRSTMRTVLAPVVTNPVILATAAGMALVSAGLEIPAVILRTMTILGNIALPLALIIIGASMSATGVRSSLALSALTTSFKLGFLPYVCFLYGKAVSLPDEARFAGIILLATPTAVTSFTLAREIGGDSDLASSTVTLSTIFSPAAFVLWAAVIR